MLPRVSDLVPQPPSGRRFRASRRVYLGDADRTGRLRLDSLTRLLQDVGNDDFADAGHDPGSPWIARRVVVEAGPWPQLGERLFVTTWCGGLGGRWAERRSSATTEEGGRAEVAALWVSIDGAGRPARIPPWFLDTWGEGAQGRTVSARLALPPPPAGAPARPWAVRATDLDVLGHVNNAATWAAVEDELARCGLMAARAELEYGAAVEPDDDVVLRSTVADGVLSVWLTVGGDVRVAARVVATG